MEDRDADIHNFSPSSSQHRLPTVSAIEALQNAAAKAKGIPCGLPALDELLPSNRGLSLATPGIQRGHVTEVYGPPGVGKTTFGLQLVVNAINSLQEDSHVLWVNTGSPLIQERLMQLMNGYGLSSNGEPSSSAPSPKQHDVETLLDAKFMYLEADTLPRLLTLFVHPTRAFPSAETALIIVDDLSNLVLGSFSRNPKNLKPSAPAVVKEKWEKRAAGKRFQIIETLAAAMSKMAALRNVGILVLTNATLSLKSSQKATLKPALSSQAWDTAVHTRIMLYHDFPDEEQESEMLATKALGLRYAEIQRSSRKDVFTNPVAFVILAGGLRELSQPKDIPNPKVTPDLNDVRPFRSDDDLPLLPVELSQQSQSKKRKVIEIADSEDEEELDPLSDIEGPELPKMRNVDDEESADEAAAIANPNAEDEMILDIHETALLRRYRYARIRGSEDAIPIPSSSDADEEGDENDEEETDER